MTDQIVRQPAHPQYADSALDDVVGQRSPPRLLLLEFRWVSRWEFQSMPPGMYSSDLARLRRPHLVRIHMSS